MKRVLFDTNVILDVLLERKPFFRVSSLALSHLPERGVKGFVSAHAIPTIVYIADRSMPIKEARRKTALLCANLAIAAVTERVIRNAFVSSIRDFEDAITHGAAEESRVDLIVSRNIADFAKGAVPVALPEVFLQSFAVSPRKSDES